MLVAAHTSAPLLQGDALQLPMPDASVDGVTCGFALRNFVALEPFLARWPGWCGRAVASRSRGVDTGKPDPAGWGHSVYFGHVVPRIGALLSDGAAYRYLPKSVAYLPDTDALLQMVRDAGFTDVRRYALSFGIAQLITGTERAVKAVTRRIDDDLDLLEVGEILFERNRLGLAGRGVAARVPVSDAGDVLAAIEVDDEVGLPGSGPVAFGALPFDSDVPAELIIPAELWGRTDDGTRWHTTIHGDSGVPGSHPRQSWDARIPEQVLGGADERRSRGASWSKPATKVMADGPMRKVVLAPRDRRHCRRGVRPHDRARPVAGDLPQVPRVLRRRLRGREPRAPRVTCRGHRALAPDGRHGRTRR